MVGHGRGLAGVVEAVVHVVAPDALPEPRRLVVQPRDALLETRGRRRRRERGGLSRRRGHRTQAGDAAAAMDARRGVVVADWGARGEFGAVEQRRVSHLRRRDARCLNI